MNTHILRTHPETRNERLLFPYCPASFCNIGNPNVHFKKRRCANNPGKGEEERWADIANANKIDTQISAEEKEKNEQEKLSKSYFAKMEKYFG